MKVGIHVKKMLYLCIVKGLTPRPSPKGEGTSAGGSPLLQEGLGEALNS